MANKKRPKQIIFRLSEDEYDLLQKKIKESGKNQQEYLLKSALNKPIINADGIKELMPELKKQGTNLNQLTKKLNEKGFVDYKQDLPKMTKELSEVWQSLKQYLQKQI